jgi:UDP-N-acetylmuramoyl-tripeptide--D-alanyl-D-alanine ligase
MQANVVKKTKSLISKKLNLNVDLQFSTDSRNLAGANAFICLYGDNFDAFELIDSMIDEGLDVIFYEERTGRDSIIKKYKDSGIEFVSVRNVFDFLLELGNLNSAEFKKAGGKLIGLTGSNGKTTNKEMLAWLLNGVEDGKVLWTKGNLNNHIGVPLTLLRLNSTFKYAIVEMGTNHPGEIEVLAKTARPSHAMITNIGHAHLENLIDLNGVFKEKTALYREVEKSIDSFILINEFDHHLKNYKAVNRFKSINEESVEFIKDGFNIKHEGIKYKIQNNTLLGTHQKINMVQCLFMAMELCPSKVSELIDLANSFKMPSMNRGEVKEIDGKEVFLDAYNANPDSMRASLTGFVELLKSRTLAIEDCLFVLGDMNELGDSAPEQHLKIGEFLNELGAKKVGFVGRYCSDYAKGFGSAETFKDIDQARLWFSNTEAPFAFIKGSRSLQLESILDIKGV